jgi:hypothetical protein
MRSKYPDDKGWSLAEKSWDGNVYLGDDHSRASYTSFGKCVYVRTEKTAQARMNARLLLAWSSVASQDATCSEAHMAILKESVALGIPLALDCDDIVQHGLKDSKTNLPNIQWKGRAPEECHAERHIFPEYVGMPVSIVRTLFPGKTVQLATWDSGDVYRPARQDTVRIVYDTRTGLVVDPAPHTGTVNVPVRDGNCFSLPDVESTTACIGAPLVAEDRWRAFVGSYITDAIDSLRVWYPHATIEALPDTARVSSDLRSDRIRVRFNTESGRVVTVPSVG